MTEPPWWIRQLMFQFAGGDAWIVALVAFSVLLLILWPKFPQAANHDTEGKSPPRPRLKLAAFLLVFAIVWGAASGEAFPISLSLLMATAGAVLVLLAPGVLLIKSRPSDVSSLEEESLSYRPRHGTRWIYAGLYWGLALGLCATWVGAAMDRIGPQSQPRQVSDGSLMVIGDSVTAGLNDGDRVWPGQLQSPWKITTVAQPGATVKSAMKQLELLPEESGTLLIEIGGNDILGPTTLTEYRERLDQLLTAASRRPYDLVLLELPWPPLSQPYALVHRELAAKHRVRLIPRRRFMQILTTTGATYDGIHLTDYGHSLFAWWVENEILVGAVHRRTH
ncbi:MAG: hypothetical protein C0478_11685 [Planctomyces sp.]|nr:hypothetical protein [Planctomyces sp.]